MKKLIDLIQEELVKAFTAAEMDPSYARVSVSNRPDLCEYQCNGAMAAAKAYHKAPIQLAEAVVEKVTDHSVIGEIEAVKPGFINLKINPEFLADYLQNAERRRSFCRESKKSENHHRRLRRSKRGKTASRRPSPFRDHRGKH